MNWNQETVNIIYASNDGYACHLAASLVSLLENNRQIPKMDVYVLSVGMCGQYQERLRKIASRYGRKLLTVELGDLKERFPYDIDTRGFDISAMGRLFAQEALPLSVEKALYLDCDTIVCGSIAPLYETELGEKLVGMVMEPTAYASMRQAIGLTQDDPYYNSGVLLMALGQWRVQNVLKQLLEFYAASKGSLFACDQDTLNGALRGRILSLPPKYNFFTNYRYYRYGTLASICSSYRRVGERAFKEAKRSPVILHYLGDERPWIYGNHNYYRRLYESYLNMTPWKGMEKVKGKFLYMQAWWILNHVTWFWPGARLWVSRCFGMKVIDRRTRKIRTD